MLILKLVWNYIKNIFTNFILGLIIISLFFFIIITFGYTTEYWGINFVNNLIHGKSTSSDLKITFFSKNIFFDNLIFTPIPSKSSTLSFLLTLIAGTGGLLLLVLNFKKYNQTQKQISLTEDNNLNTTFKDAVTLLGNDNVSVSMGGVYTLIDIAKKNPTKYSKRISAILCQHIVDRSNIEYSNYLKENGVSKEDAKIFEDINFIKNLEICKNYTKNNNILLKELHKLNYLSYEKENFKRVNDLDKLQDKHYNYLVTQKSIYNTIYKLLTNFKSSNEILLTMKILLDNNIFDTFDKDLSSSKLFGIPFNPKNKYLKKITLSNSIVFNCSFSNLLLYNIDYNNSIIYNSIFNQSNIQYCNFSYSIILTSFFLVNGFSPATRINYTYISDCHICADLLDRMENSIIKNSVISGYMYEELHPVSYSKTNQEIDFDNVTFYLKEDKIKTLIYKDNHKAFESKNIHIAPKRNPSHEPN